MCVAYIIIRAIAGSTLVQAQNVILDQGIICLVVNTHVCNSIRFVVVVDDAVFEKKKKKDCV